MNGQMINVSASSVVTAQCDANNRRAISNAKEIARKVTAIIENFKD